MANTSLFTNATLGQTRRVAAAEYYQYGTMPRFEEDEGSSGSGGMTMGEMDPFFVPALPVGSTARKEGAAGSKKGNMKKTRKAPEVKQPTFLSKLYG